jgi:hypothetical protein
VIAFLLDNPGMEAANRPGDRLAIRVEALVADAAARWRSPIST